MRIKSRKTEVEQIITQETWEAMGEMQNKFTIVSMGEEPFVNFAVPLIAQNDQDNSMDFSADEVLAKLQLMRTKEEVDLFTRDETRGKLIRAAKKLNFDPVSPAVELPLQESTEPNNVTPNPQ